MEPYLRPEGQQLRQGEASTPSAGRPVSGEANPLALLLAIMGDPRNSWMGGPGKIVHGAEALPALVAGLGPLFKSGRGWEVLKEYMAKGGTPQTLRTLLRDRGIHEQTVGRVGDLVRKGTDLAAPPGRRTAVENSDNTVMKAVIANLRERYPAKALEGPQPTLDQQRALETASRELQNADEYRHSGPSTAGEKSALHGQFEESWQAHGNPPNREQPMIPSGAGGQAAYNAIAGRMGKLMDDPNFLSLRTHYLPPPVSDAEYWKAHPIEQTGGGTYADFHNMAADSVARHLEAMARQQRGLAPPRTFSAAENQRTTDLNRRADQNQNPSSPTPMLAPTPAPAMPRYEVYDPRTGVIHGNYGQRGRARAHMDRLDNEYGAVRYAVRTIDPPQGTP